MKREHLRPAAAAVFAAAALAACTTHGNTPNPPASSKATSTASVATSLSPSAAHTTSAPTDGGVQLGTPPCVVAPPAAWKHAQRRGQLWQGVWDLHPTGAPSPDGSGTLLQQDAGAVSHIVLVGADHRTITRAGDVPNPVQQGQITFSAIGADYGEFIFAPINGQEASWRWQLYLWDRRKHQLRLIAHNPVDSAGRPLHGGWVQPQLTADAITWIQAAPDTTHGWGGSALKEYSLATGRIRTLYTGLVTAFVRYGDDVLYAAIKPGAPAPSPTDSNGPPLRINAANALTGTPATAPAGLTFGSDSANVVVTDGDLIVWANDTEIRGWRPSWGRSVTLVPDPGGWPAGAKLGASGPTYPRVYGHFLAWNAGPTLVLDLRSNSVAKLTSTPGGDEMSGPWLSLESYTTPTSFKRDTGIGQFDQTLVDLTRLPDLPAC